MAQRNQHENKFIIEEARDPEFLIAMIGDVDALESVPGLQFKIAGIPGITRVVPSPTDANHLVVSYQATMPDVRRQVCKVINNLIAATKDLPRCSAILTEDQ